MKARLTKGDRVVLPVPRRVVLPVQNRSWVSDSYMSGTVLHPGEPDWPIIVFPRQGPLRIEPGRARVIDPTNLEEVELWLSNL
jgi:hypothetical protein